MPKISVIVPIYKVEQYLNRCVDSILNQTFKDFEIILVDDCSPDNCGKICDDYALKYDFVHVIHKENGGVSDARNYGIDWAFNNSDSEWITFIDSDDLVHKQFLEFLYYSVISKKTDIGMCGITTFNNNVELEKWVNKTYQVKCKRNNADKFFGKTNYSLGQFVSPCNKIFKKSVFINHRFPKGIRYEDERLIPRLVLDKHYISVVPLGLYFYFINESGFMRSALTSEKMNTRLTVLTDNCEFFYDNGYFNILDRYFKRMVDIILRT